MPITIAIAGSNIIKSKLVVFLLNKVILYKSATQVKLNSKQKLWLIKNCIFCLQTVLLLSSPVVSLTCTLGNNIQHYVVPKLFSYTPLGDGGFGTVQSALQKQTGFNVRAKYRNRIFFEMSKNKNYATGFFCNRC